MLISPHKNNKGSPILGAALKIETVTRQQILQLVQLNTVK